MPNRHRHRHKFPNPELSCGSLCRDPPRLGGMKTIWMARGPALENEQSIMAYVGGEINRAGLGDLRQAIQIVIYMIGPDETTANPTVCIIHPDRAKRKAIVRHLKLTDFFTLYPAFLIGSFSCPPVKHARGRWPRWAAGDEFLPYEPAFIHGKNPIDEDPLASASRLDSSQRHLDPHQASHTDANASHMKSRTHQYGEYSTQTATPYEYGDPFRGDVGQCLETHQQEEFPQTFNTEEQLQAVKHSVDQLEPTFEEQVGSVPRAEANGGLMSAILPRHLSASSLSLAPQGIGADMQVETPAMHPWHPPRQPQQERHERLFMCSLDGCGERFSVAKDLRRHQQGTHPKNEFQSKCDFCGMTFGGRLDSLKRHLKNRHGVFNADRDAPMHQDKQQQSKKPQDVRSGLASKTLSETAKNAFQNTDASAAASSSGSSAKTWDQQPSRTSPGPELTGRALEESGPSSPRRQRITRTALAGTQGAPVTYGSQAGPLKATGPPSPRGRPPLSAFSALEKRSLPSAFKPLDQDGTLTVNSSSPCLGRRVAFRPEGGATARILLGGVVIALGSDLFQLTAGHFAFAAADDAATSPRSSSSPVEFIWDTDTDDDDDDDDETEDTNMNNSLNEFTSRESISDDAPDEVGFSWDDSSSATESLSSGDATRNAGQQSPSGSQGIRQGPAAVAGSSSTEETGEIFATNQSNTNKRQTPLNSGNGEGSELSRSFGRVQQRTSESRVSAYLRVLPQLDYALIAIEDAPYQFTFNRIPTNHASAGLQIKDWACIGTQERDVLVVTSAAGPAIRGVLSPAAAFFRDPGQTDLHALYSVVLDGVVGIGVSGAAVVDARSGDLCGHVARVCDGASLAYIVPAQAVFEDLSQQLGNVPIEIA